MTSQELKKGHSRNPGQCRDATTAAFLAQNPGQASDITWTAGQRAFYVILFAALLLAWLAGGSGSSYPLYVFYTLYLAVILFRALSVGLALFGRPEIIVTPEELAQAGKPEWPRYTVLVPLYREPQIAAKTIRYLDRLDYPPERLEILLLLEEDDELTQRALGTIRLPGHFRVIKVPHSLPRTKAKACNWGLRESTGENLVIYDAEDRPDPDQLKKAATAFRRIPEHVICLQAKLSYYNPGQNLLTRWFTMEYAVWFDLYLPGLYRMQLPIPLGGTSNHFRRRILEQLGGWDPFNVAEDCDLGIRLHRMGYRTAMLDTTTWEEANSRLRNWIRQRSRWVKGYLQTHLVHSRRPRRSFGELGILGTFSFLMSVGGHSLVLLVNPVIWALALTSVRVSRPGLAGRGTSDILASLGDIFANHSTGFPRQGPLLIAGSIIYLLIAANFMFIIFNLVGCLKRRLGLGYLLLAVASPAYWVLISVGAWKRLLQLLRRPHYWEKTDHGLFPETEPADRPAVRAAELGEGSEERGARA